MQNPQLTACAVALLMLFSSCQREHILGQNPEPAPSVELEQRCCTDLTEDILISESYQDIWFGIHVGLVEPSLNLFEAMDTGYLYSTIRAFEECILAGQPPEDCAEALLDAFSISGFLNFIHHNGVDSLRHEFADVPDDLFFASLEEALAASIADLEDDRRLTCFIAYRASLREASKGLAKILVSTNRAAAIVTSALVAIDLINARASFCECLYQNYGEGC